MKGENLSPENSKAAAAENSIEANYNDFGSVVVPKKEAAIIHVAKRKRG